MTRLRTFTCSQGEFESIKKASEHFGVATSTIQGRLAKGWTADEAVGIVKRKKSTTGKVLQSSIGHFDSIRDAAKKLGLKAENISNRLSLGWSVDEALELTPRQVRHPSRGKQVICDGKKFNSVSEFADFYFEHHQQNKVRTRKRLDSGWTPEEAVELHQRPPRFRNKDGSVRDHAWTKKTVSNAGEIVPDSAIGQYHLYLLKNIDNNKEYIGITTGNLKKRLRGHWNMVSRGRHSKLYNAMRESLERRGNKTGFKMTLIRSDFSGIDELQAEEAKEIAKRNSINKGYNTASGGSVGTPKPIEVDGQLFASRASAAEYYGIDVALVNLRLSRLKWTPEQAFELDRSKIVKQEIEVAGEKFDSIQSACEAFGLKYKNVHRRLKKAGWTVDQAFELTSPPKPSKPSANAKSIELNGKTFKSLAEVARFVGVSTATIINRLKAGWTDKQILGLVAPPGKNKGV